MAPKKKSGGKKAAKKEEPKKVDPFDVEEMLKFLSEAERENLVSDNFKEEAITAFEKADVSQTGFLDGDEMIKAVHLVVSPHRRASMQVTEENVKELLMHFDADGNGRIDKQEFFNFVKWCIAKEVKDYFSNERGEKQAQGKKELDEALDDLFTCYDTDEDGLLERVELLEGDEAIEIFLEGKGATLGVKERRECIKWFKEAGCEKEGTMMFLSKEKFMKSYPSRLVERLSRSEHLDERTRRFDPVETPGLLAQFIRYRFLDDFWKKRFPPKKGDKKECGNPVFDADGKPAKPEYPATIIVNELKENLFIAKAHDLPVVVLYNDNENVETFFKYQNVITADLKGEIGAIARKQKSKAQLMGELRVLLKRAMVGAMDGMLLPRPLWFRFSNSCFQLKDYVDDAEGLPQALFRVGDWNPQKALEMGIIDSVTMDKYNAEPEKFDNFHMYFTSSFTLEKAKEFGLPDAIPGMMDFAIITVNENQ